MKDHHYGAEDPAQIEREIVRTRASLQRKLEELQHRLSPRERVKAVAQRVDPRPYAGVAALAAVGIGTGMAVKQWRRHRGSNGIHNQADMMGE
jgi:ElaB/YqjD/DUF883 family membrane-anchored ribosome-binding protein